ncbi:MAG: aminodeoxychorismate synthase component I [Gammaproteobacteria bacterium]
MYFQTRPLAGPEIAESRLTNLYQLKPDHYSFILASTATTDNHHFDILLAHPQQSLELYHRDIAANKPGFLDALQAWWLREKIDPAALVSDESGIELPFTGGWFIYLAYELVAEIEPVLELPAPDQDEPVALAVRCPCAVIFDHQRKRHIAVAEQAYSDLLDTIERDFHAAVESSEPAADLMASVRALDVREADEAPYLAQVARIKQYIVDGDIFQANLSRPWRLEIEPHTRDTTIFNHLARANPGSFAVLARLPHACVISSSPERLVSVRGGIIETRPIAGTRPRSEDEKTDDRLAAELLAHPKEQAEHIMLIDLERNDLGRICVPGSIRVDELMTLESYQHVHHIVSNITGRLRDDITPADVIRAVFPGGTITGCPKVRCIEILAEMEQQVRGAYTGSIGYINRNGDMDVNILIRTLVRRGNTIHFRAGGGIVADSDAARELAETRAKAKGLLRAFGID